MDFAVTLESIIKQKVNDVLNGGKNLPDMPEDLIYTDNLGEVVEKLVILHIRTWFLEDMAGLAKTDEELADIKRKIDTCFKQKRPMYVQAINKMVDNAIVQNKSLVENSVKIYKNF